MWGWGVYSDVTFLVAAQRPLQVTDLSASVVNSTGDFRVDWTLPDN
jgi:hypothetical protein